MRTVLKRYTKHIFLFDHFAYHILGYMLREEDPKRFESEMSRQWIIRILPVDRSPILRRGGHTEN